MHERHRKRRPFARGRGRIVFEVRDELGGVDEALVAAEAHLQPFHHGEKTRERTEARGGSADRPSADLPLIPAGPCAASRARLLIVGGASTLVALALVIGAAAHERPSAPTSPAGPRQEARSGRAARGEGKRNGAIRQRRRPATHPRRAGAKRELRAEPPRNPASALEAETPLPLAASSPPASTRAPANEFSFER